MKTKYKWIEFFDESNPKHKTSCFCIQNHSNEIIGWIEWHIPWRQYCLYPEDQMVFNKGCLEDINHFIKQLMDARKKKS